MRQGVHYRLSSPVSHVWQQLGENTLGNILDKVATELNVEDAAAFRHTVLQAMLSANAAGLICLYPEDS